MIFSFFNLIDLMYLCAAAYVIFMVNLYGGQLGVS